jgi:hypothetical protein
VIPTFADEQCTPEHRNKIKEMTQQGGSHGPHHCTIGHHLKSGLILQRVAYKSTAAPTTKRVSLASLKAKSSPRPLITRKQKRKYANIELTVGLWHSVGIRPDMVEM